MKYRGVEIQEISVGVSYDPENISFTGLNGKLKKYLDVDFVLEYVDNKFAMVRYSKYENDLEELAFAIMVYSKLKQLSYLDVSIDIVTEDWFELDGKEYNYDSVNFNTFITNLSV